ncbi:Bifunctional DNA primase/polymerase, N-terminal [Actinopolyspora xinjiangensis]|uniref:Bifunctional DNA primase/polymerase, N-terminal n=1 Tax=Actinopolyspora xinjiangensis TaxID=405564 RepID=A0A1H0WXJ4_9ACTN|nr:bifunctional DNA primase/polymerase [Actinopolyspora xinjiangensis]SDP95310.1 Bifunctional DNA primase/polymerase, N-terminal [Actinopolyspora xinjiangensis]
MDLAAEGWHNAFRIELRVQVFELASRGWPVFPGSYPSAEGWIGHETSAEDLGHGPVPVHRDWRDRLTADASDVAGWWANRPYSVLLATGDGVEAIEVDADLGRRAAIALRALATPTPIAATPYGRWYFFTAAGRGLDEELAGTAGVRLHSTGSWLPLPPSTFPNGVLHWRVKPQLCDWRLPDSAHVQDALTTGLHQLSGTRGRVLTAAV